MSEYKGEQFKDINAAVSYFSTAMQFIVNASNIRTACKTCGRDIEQLIQMTGRSSMVAIAFNKIAALEERVASLESLIQD